jgi:hypothetical protein
MCRVILLSLLTIATALPSFSICRAQQPAHPDVDSSGGKQKDPDKTRHHHRQLQLLRSRREPDPSLDYRDRQPAPVPYALRRCSIQSRAEAAG